jgi:hypothetical protein
VQKEEKKPKKRLRRGADGSPKKQLRKKGNETDSQAEDSAMEDDAGGSS